MPDVEATLMQPHSSLTTRVCVRLSLRSLPHGEAVPVVERGGLTRLWHRHGGLEHGKLRITAGVRLAAAVDSADGSR